MLDSLRFSETLFDDVIVFNLILGGRTSLIFIIIRELLDNKTAVVNPLRSFSIAEATKFGRSTIDYTSIHCYVDTGELVFRLTVYSSHIIDEILFLDNNVVLFDTRVFFPI